jgi:hypothetical protein
MDISSTIMTSSKEWWGPRIWRILHSLAELSDRSDCMFLWKGVLRHTADILPCELCRTHFHARIPSYHASIALQRDLVRERIRDFLWSSHQSVNEQHAKTGIPREKLVDEYGVREGYTRNDITQLVISLVDEIVGRFSSDNVLDRFRANIPILWRREIMSLIHTLTVPEVQGATSSSGRRGRARPGRRM